MKHFNERRQPLGLESSPGPSIYEVGVATAQHYTGCSKKRATDFCILCVERVRVYIYCLLRLRTYLLFIKTKDTLLMF
jgi:hypothetical protein